MDTTKEDLIALVEYAIHHLSCGYVSNDGRINALHRLQRGLHKIRQANTGLQADGVGAVPENEDWLNEPMCSNCGHSKSRHQTAGGFCKHCTCNEFVEPATQPRR